MNEAKPEAEQRDSEAKSDSEQLREAIVEEVAEFLRCFYREDAVEALRRAFPEEALTCGTAKAESEEEAAP